MKSLTMNDDKKSFVILKYPKICNFIDDTINKELEQKMGRNPNDITVESLFLLEVKEAKDRMSRMKERICYFLYKNHEYIPEPQVSKMISIYGNGIVLTWNNLKFLFSLFDKADDYSYLVLLPDDPFVEDYPKNKSIYDDIDDLFLEMMWK